MLYKHGTGQSGNANLQAGIAGRDPAVRIGRWWGMTKNIACYNK